MTGARRWTLLALSLVAAVLLVACGDDAEEPSSRVVAQIPWKGEEHLFYRLTQKGVDGDAECELQTVPPSAGAGALTLVRLCQQAEHRDDATALVDPVTLLPQKSTRVYSDAKKDRKTTYTNTYSGTTVRFDIDIDGKVRTTTRDLPTPTAASPEPGWYDDDETLWLVRTVPLRSGYTGTFTYVINAGQPRVLATKVHVDEIETVKVPVGEIRAFRVRLVRDNVVWAYWVEEAAPHRVIRARIEDSTYELTRAQ